MHSARTSTPTVPQRLMYSLPEVAVLTSQSIAEVKREVARGSIASVKRGRRRLVTAGQLSAYVQRLECASAA